MQSGFLLLRKIAGVSLMMLLFLQPALSQIEPRKELQEGESFVVLTVENMT